MRRLYYFGGTIAYTKLGFEVVSCNLVHGEAPRIVRNMCDYCNDADKSQKMREYPGNSQHKHRRVRWTDAGSVTSFQLEWRSGSGCVNDGKWQYLRQGFDTTRDEALRRVKKGQFKESS